MSRLLGSSFIENMAIIRVIGVLDWLSSIPGVRLTDVLERQEFLEFAVEACYVLAT